MNDKGIAYDNGHRCYVFAPDGRTKRFLGCNHGDVPRAAIAHTVPVYVSPLRSSPDGSHVASVAPPWRGGSRTRPVSLGENGTPG